MGIFLDSYPTASTVQKFVSDYHSNNRLNTSELLYQIYTYHKLRKTFLSFSDPNLNLYFWNLVLYRLKNM